MCKGQGHHEGSRAPEHNKMRKECKQLGGLWATGRAILKDQVAASLGEAGRTANRSTLAKALDDIPWVAAALSNATTLWRSRRNRNLESRHLQQW